MIKYIQKYLLPSFLGRGMGVGLLAAPQTTTRRDQQVSLKATMHSLHGHHLTMTSTNRP